MSIMIFCEGNYDTQILSQKVLAGLTDFSVKPIGGKTGVRAIISYLSKNEVTADKPKSYVFFRDRDFDAPVPDNVRLTQDEKHDDKVFFSYRTTIENYLLSPKCFFDFCDNKFSGKFSNENEVGELFFAAANKIKDYQAVRHALGKMREKTSLDTRWEKKDGDLPKSLELEKCEECGWNLILEAKDKADKWTRDAFEENVHYFLGLLNDDFFNSRKYLIWFQGKDFASALCQEIEQKKGLKDFPLKSYYRFAINEMNYLDFDDLVEFRNVIEKKINN